jgi:hypothetical protein
MSKKSFKSQASSARAASIPSSAAFGTFATPQPTFVATSVLSYISEPPDLSSISDPTTVVAFKNLTKKDATTKAKALDDLHTYFVDERSEDKTIEGAFVDAWVTMGLLLSPSYGWT